MKECPYVFKTAYYFSMDPLDSLEERIKNLERKLLPEGVTINQTTSITDTLLNVKSMLTTALSCRDVVIRMMTKLEELDKCIDPNYSDNEYELNTKREYVMEVYTKFTQFVNLMKEFHKLKDTINSKNLDNVMELSDKLDTAIINNTNIYLENVDVTEKIFNCIRQIYDITVSLKTLFAQLDINLYQVELPPGKKVEVDE